MNPQEKARLGEFHLEEAILDVLLEAFHSAQDCLGPAEISRRAGVFRERGTVKGLIHDAITAGILAKLHTHNRVERCKQANGRGGWKLTPAEYRRRNG